MKTHFKTTRRVIRNAPLKAYLRTLILQTVKKYIFQSYQSPSGPVYTRKTLQVFRIYEDSFEHENPLQNYQGKRATYTIQNDRGDTLSTIHGFPPSRKQYTSIVW